MSNIITDNRLRVFAFGVNTGIKKTTILYSLPIPTQPQPPVVIVPPLTEAQAMDADVKAWQATGKLPEFIVPWLGEDEGRFD